MVFIDIFCLVKYAFFIIESDRMVKRGVFVDLWCDIETKYWLGLECFEHHKTKTMKVVLSGIKLMFESNPNST